MTYLVYQKVFWMSKNKIPAAWLCGDWALFLLLLLGLDELPSRAGRGRRIEARLQVEALFFHLDLRRLQALRVMDDIRHEIPARVAADLSLDAVVDGPQGIQIVLVRGF